RERQVLVAAHAGAGEDPLLEVGVVGGEDVALAVRVEVAEPQSGKVIEGVRQILPSGWTTAPHAQRSGSWRSTRCRRACARNGPASPTRSSRARGDTPALPAHPNDFHGLHPRRGAVADRERRG